MRDDQYIASNNATEIDPVSQTEIEEGWASKEALPAEKLNLYFKYISQQVSNITQELKTVLAAAGMTPDDTATQILPALTTLFCPTGAILEYPCRTAPTGFLMVNGAAVSRTTYSNLFNYLVPSIGTCTITIATPAVINLNSHGFITGDQIYLTTTGALPVGLTANTLYYVIYIDANTFNLATSRDNAFAGTKINTSGSQSGTHTLRFCPFGLGDGSTTFNLPDKSEAYGVGIGTRGSGVTAHDAFTLGEFKDDQIQGHYHQSVYNPTATIAQGSYDTNYGYKGSIDANVNGCGSPTSDGVNGTPRIGTTTRGKAIGLNYIIKY